MSPFPRPLPRHAQTAWASLVTVEQFTNGADEHRAPHEAFTHRSRGEARDGDCSTGAGVCLSTSIALMQLFGNVYDNGQFAKVGMKLRRPGELDVESTTQPRGVGRPDPKRTLQPPFA